MFIHRLHAGLLYEALVLTLFLFAVDGRQAKIDVTKPPGIDEICGANEAIYIEDIKIETNGSCKSNLSSPYSEKTLKDFIQRDCSGRQQCKLNDSLRYMDRFLCDSTSRFVNQITLEYYCKLFEFSSNKVFNISSRLSKNSSVENDTIFLAMKSAPNWRSRSCTVTSDAPMTMILLQVDFNDDHDLPPSCRGLLEIKDINGTVINSWNSTNTSSGIRNDSHFEIDVMMTRGLVWIEINTTQTVNITCVRGNNNRLCKGDDQAGPNELRDCDEMSRKDVVIIVLGLVAGLSMLILICTCAVFVCRVRVRCGLLSPWITSILQSPVALTKIDDDFNSTDTSKLFKQDSPSPTYDNQVHSNCIIDVTTNHVTPDQDYSDPSQDIEAASGNSTCQNQAKLSSKYESIRRTSLPLLKVGKVPHFNINGKTDVKIFGSQFRLNNPQTPDIIHLSPSSNLRLLSSAPGSNKVSVLQTPEVAQLSPAASARLLSSEPNSRKGSPTLTPKMGSPKFLAELNALLPMQKLVASPTALKDDVVEYNNSPTLTSSVYSLASYNSNEKITGDEECLYSNDDSQRGEYSHLNPFGNQKKFLNNVYDG